MFLCASSQFAPTSCFEAFAIALNLSWVYMSKMAAITPSLPCQVVSFLDKLARKNITLITKHRTVNALAFNSAPAP
jgi:hypothetical protein